MFEGNVCHGWQWVAISVLQILLEILKIFNNIQNTGLAVGDHISSTNCTSPYCTYS